MTRALKGPSPISPWGEGGVRGVAGSNPIWQRTSSETPLGFYDWKRATYSTIQLFFMSLLKNSAYKRRHKENRTKVKMRNAEIYYKSYAILFLTRTAHQ